MADWRIQLFIVIKWQKEEKLDPCDMLLILYLHPLRKFKIYNMKSNNIRRRMESSYFTRRWLDLALEQFLIFSLSHTDKLEAFWVDVISF